MPIKSDPTTWKDPRHRRGLEGEEMAHEFLQGRGWHILEHRFRMGRLEVDLVAQRGSVVAFVEVKTRFGNAFGDPVEAVTASKRREIAKVAQAWIDRYGGDANQYRLDVVGVTLHRRGPPQIQHVEDAFRLGWR